MPGAIRKVELAGIGVLSEFIDREAHFGKAIERDPLRERLIPQVAAGARRPAHCGHQAPPDRSQRSSARPAPRPSVKPRQDRALMSAFPDDRSSRARPCRGHRHQQMPSLGSHRATSVRRKGVPSPLAAIATCGPGGASSLPIFRSRGLSTTVCESSCSWKLTPLGRSRWLEFMFLVEREPAIVELDRKPRTHRRSGSMRSPKSRPFEQRAFVQQLHQALDAPALFIELRVAPGHADRQYRQRDDHGHDHHDHQYLDQRKALGCAWRGARKRAIYLCSRVEVLMSAS